MTTAQMTMREVRVEGYEQVLVCEEPGCGYCGVIAIHSTRRGPAVGGVRMLSYRTEAEAVRDACRLARGMSWKTAFADLPLGGGKSVILSGDNGEHRAARLRAHARAIDRFGGDYIAGEDVGTTPEDMDLIAQETRHVAGRSTGIGNPAQYTALGVASAMEALATHLWNGSMAGRRVAIQGVGAVGARLAHLLSAAGAVLLLADRDALLVRRLARAVGAQVCSPESVVATPVDILAPCALGSVFTRTSVPLVGAGAIAGAANDQLGSAEDGDRLHDRGVVYLPDYVVNAGGVIAGTVDILGWDSATAAARIRGIGRSVTDLLEQAEADGLAPHRVADRIAAGRLGGT